ncbi:hypothetical protein F5141DRAFT_1061674 [Pisolithus sp. B1]|nr:hypothetical protein F5141DRAFT_1061674 [Pisolithus sp. B1]
MFTTAPLHLGSQQVVSAIMGVSGFMTSGGGWMLTMFTATHCIGIHSNQQWIWFVVLLFYCFEFDDPDSKPFRFLPFAIPLNPSQYLSCLPQGNMQCNLLLNMVLAKNGRNDLQEDLTSAVEKYQSSAKMLNRKE